MLGIQAREDEAPQEPASYGDDEAATSDDRFGVELKDSAARISAGIVGGVSKKVENLQQLYVDKDDADGEAERAHGVQARVH
jgi:hypothetical protein